MYLYLLPKSPGLKEAVFENNNCNTQLLKYTPIDTYLKDFKGFCEIEQELCSLITNSSKAFLLIEQSLLSDFLT